MAAIAIPLIEAVVARVLVALGAIVVGGAVVDEVAKEQERKRQEEADKAKSGPVTRTDSTTKTRKKCKDCPPDQGAHALQNTAGWSQTAILYQIRIAQMPPAPPGFLSEWSFGGMQFDGFDSSQCLLKEAKAKYDQFFDEFRQVKDWWRGGADKMIDEAYRQAAAAQPRPPVQLRWHFMQPISYRYFSRIIQAAYPDVQVVYQP